MKKTVIKRLERRGRNSYIDNIYFNKIGCSLCISIDFVTLSNIHPNKKDLLFNILESNKFVTVKDVILKDGNYHRVRIYKNDHNNTVDIFYDQKDLSKGFNFLLLTIHHPNQEIMLLLDSIFKYHEIEPKVSLVEMTFDFHTDKIIDFHRFIKSHLFLKNKRSKSGVFKGAGDTFYANKVRTSTKGMRLYIKRTETRQIFVRLELILHRPLIHRLGLQFPLNNIDNLNLSKFFYFACLKVDDVKKYLLWKSRKQLKEIDPFDAEIIEDHVEGWFRQKDSLMDKIEVMRDDIKLKNYNRFIKPIDDINIKFLDIISSQKFIPSRFEEKIANHKIGNAT